MKRLALAMVLLAGCASHPTVENSIPISHELSFAPDPKSTERAPLEGLGDAGALLRDACADSTTIRLLDRMTGHRPFELAVVESSSSAAKEPVHAPTPPSVASMRVVPGELTLEARADGSRVGKLTFLFEESCVSGTGEDVFDPVSWDCTPGFSTHTALSRSRAFLLALDEFLQRRSRGWMVGAPGDRKSAIDGEVADGERLWPK